MTIHFHPEMLKKAYGDSLPSFLKKPIDDSQNFMVHVKASELVKKYIEGVLFYVENEQLVTEEILVLKLKEIILLLLQTDNDIFPVYIEKYSFLQNIII